MTRIITVELLVEDSVVADEMLGQLEAMAESSPGWDSWIGFHDFVDTVDGRMSKARLALAEGAVRSAPELRLDLRQRDDQASTGAHEPTLAMEKLAAMGGNVFRNRIDGQWYASLAFSQPPLHTSGGVLEQVIEDLWRRWLAAGRPPFRMLDPQARDRADKVIERLDLALRNALRKIGHQRREDLFPPTPEQLDVLVELGLAEWRDGEDAYRPTEFAAEYVLPHIRSVG